jgi:hypothetical protein
MCVVYERLHPNKTLTSYLWCERLVCCGLRFLNRLVPLPSSGCYMEVCIQVGYVQAEDENSSRVQVER